MDMNPIDMMMETAMVKGMEVATVGTLLLVKTMLGKRGLEKVLKDITKATAGHPMLTNGLMTEDCWNGVLLKTQEQSEMARERE